MADYCNPEDWPEGYSDIRAIDNLLRCPICFEYLNIAMMLPQCSHNYCSLCIRKYMSVKEKCPTCAMEARDNDLRNNRILDDIIRKFKGVRSTLVNVLLSGPKNVLTDIDGRSTDTFVAAPVLASPIPDRRAARSQVMTQAKTPTTSGVTRAHADSSILSNSQTSPEGSKPVASAAVLPRSRRGAGKPESSGAVNKSLVPASKKENGYQEVASDSDSEFEVEPIKKSKAKGSVQKSRKRKRSDSSFSDVAVQDASSDEEDIADPIARGRGQPKRRREPSKSPPRPAVVAEELSDSTNAQIPCPVCGVMIRKRLINMHLDKCLEADCKPRITRSPVKRKKLPKLVYSLVNDKDMKKKLREWGLPVQGDRQMLVRRHHEFTLIFNAECDAEVPRSAEEIVKELEKAEKCKSSFIALSQTKFVQLAYLPLVILKNLKLEKNATREEIDHAQKQYVKTHKNQFSKLIEDAKKKMAVAKRARQSSTDAAKSEEKSRKPDPKHVDEEPLMKKQAEDHSDEELFGSRSKLDDSNTNWDSVMSDEPKQSSSKHQSRRQHEKDESDAEDLFGSDKGKDTAPPLPSWGALMDGLEDKDDETQSAKGVCEDDADSHKRENDDDATTTVRKSRRQNKPSSTNVAEIPLDELTIEHDGEQSASEHEVKQPFQRKPKGKLKRKKFPPGLKKKVEQKPPSADESDSESDGEKREKVTSLKKKRSDSNKNALPVRIPEGTRKSPRDCKVDNYYDDNHPRIPNQEAETDESKYGSSSEDDAPLSNRSAVKRGRLKKDVMPQGSSSEDDTRLRNKSAVKKGRGRPKKNVIPQGSASEDDTPLRDRSAVKKGRGRGKKNVMPQGSSSEDDTRLRNKSALKKGRGRPKKNVIPQGSASEDDTPLRDRSAVKKGRGRLKKTVIDTKNPNSSRQSSRISNLEVSKNLGKDDIDNDDENSDGSASERSSSDSEKEEQNNGTTKTKRFGRGKKMMSSKTSDGSLLLPRSVKINKSYAMYEDREEEVDDGPKMKWSLRKHKKSDADAKCKESDTDSEKDASVDEIKEESRMKRSQVEKDSISGDVKEKTVDSDTAVDKSDNDGSEINKEDTTNKNTEHLSQTTEGKESEKRDDDGDSSAAEEIIVITVNHSTEESESTEAEKQDDIVMTLSLPSPKPVREVDMFHDDSPVSPKSLSDEIGNIIDKVTTDCETDTKETEDATSEMEVVDLDSTH